MVHVRRKMLGMDRAWEDMQNLEKKVKEEVVTVGVRQQFGVRAVVTAEEGGSELSDEFTAMQQRLAERWEIIRRFP